MMGGLAGGLGGMLGGGMPGLGGMLGGGTGMDHGDDESNGSSPKRLKKKNRHKKRK
jgi:hypothetical protein